MKRLFLMMCVLSFSVAAFAEPTWKQKQIMEHNRNRYWKHHQWKQQEKPYDVVVVEEKLVFVCPLCNGKGTLENKRGAGWVRCKKCKGKGEVTKVMKKKKKVYTE